VDARFEADQLGAALEQQVLSEAVAAVHLQGEPAEVAQFLLTEAQERATLAPELARRRGRSPPAWRRRRGGPVGNGRLSPQSSQERNAHHGAECTNRLGAP